MLKPNVVLPGINIIGTPRSSLVAKLKKYGLTFIYLLFPSAFYSSTIFVEAGYTPRRALDVSLGFGAVNFAFAFPALWTM